MRKFLFLLFILGSFSVVIKAQKPVLTIPTGQNLVITAFKITPNGHYLLSASLDRSIKVYDLILKKEVFTFWEHKNFVSAIAIGADNRTVISGDEIGNLIFWDLNTGKVKKRNDGLHRVRVTDLDISPDGKYLLSTDLNGITSGYNLKADTAIFYSIESSFSINKAHFSNDGKTYLSVSADTTFHSKKQNNLVFAKYDNDGTLIKGISSSTSLIRSADLSADNKFIYYITENPAQIIKYNIKADSIVFKDDLNGLILMDVHTIDDHNVLILASDVNKAAVLIVYDTDAKKKIKTIGTDLYVTNDVANFICMQKYPGKPEEVVFIPGIDNNIYSFNYKKYTLEILNKKESVIQSTPLIIGNELFLGGDSKVLKKWDLTSNFIDVVLRDHGSIHKLTKNNGQVLVSASGSWVVWDPKENKPIKTIIEPEAPVTKLLLSPDQKLIAVPTVNRTIKIYSAEDFRLIKTLPIAFDFSFFQIGWRSNTSLALIQSKAARTIFFYDVNKGLLPEKVNADGYMSSFTNIDARYFVALVRGAYLRLYDSYTDSTLVQRKMPSTTVFNLLKYDSRLNQLIIGTEDGNISFLNPKTLQTERVLKGHKNWVVDVTFNEDYSKLYSTGHDNTVRIWDLKNYTEISTLSILGVNSWVALGKNNLFDASPLALKKLYYVVNDSTDVEEPYKIIALDQLKHRYYQPGLLQIQMGFSKEPLRIVPALDNIELAPKLKGSLINDHLLHIELKNLKGGIGKVVVSINNAEILADARPDANKDKNLEKLIIDIDLNKYENRFANEDNVEIKIVAWNGDNWLSSVPEIVKYNPLKSKGASVNNSAPKKEVEKPRLFALVFGTADYNGTQIDLRYAGKDAADFASALKNSAQKLFGINEVEVNLFNSEATEKTQQPEKRIWLTQWKHWLKR
jgi:WD40 repeat protein